MDGLNYHQIGLIDKPEMSISENTLLDVVWNAEFKSELSKIGNQKKNVWSHVQDIFYILLRFLIRQGSDGELLLGGRIKGEMSVNVIIIHVKLCLA